MLDDYQSHLPFIVAAVVRTTGDVLELGTGGFSTPVLSDLCRMMGRSLVSYETCPRWAGKMIGNAVGRPHHTYRRVDSFTEAEIERPWGLAIIDQHDSVCRAETMQRLRGHAKVMLVHDCSTPAIVGAAEQFKYQLRLDDLEVWPCLLLSDEVDVSQWDLWRVTLSDETKQASDLAMQRHLPSPGADLMLYNKRGESLSLRDQYLGQTLFMVLGGPSLKQLDLTKLQSRGVVTMAVNNAWAVARPNFWLGLDTPSSFHDQGWKDPGITKLVPIGYSGPRHFLREKRGPTFLRSRQCANDMPGVLYFKQNSHFDPDQFLIEPTVNMGQNGKTPCSLGMKGTRSVMYSALRLAVWMGFRTINLLGCDFEMRQDAENYAFAQDRSPHMVDSNNASFEQTSKRLAALSPKLEAAGVRVFNCNPHSGLKVFPHKSYDQAMAEVVKPFTKPMDTAGWYEHQEEKMAKAPHESECNEYVALKNRQFRDYSEGHRRMYTAPIELLMSDEKNVRCKPLKIIEAGVGIAYGLKLMLAAGIVGSFHGWEPNKDSFDYSVQRFGTDPRVRLYHQDWLEAELPYVADYTFCIEVIEHVKPELVPAFLKKLREATGTMMFFSTPDIASTTHGVRTAPEWKQALQEAGFDVVFNQRQWTTLFFCQPR